MKLILELVIAVVLHPLAWILVLVDLARRDDLTAAQKVIWAVVSIVWGLGPILYLLVGGGVLWGRGRL